MTFAEFLANFLNGNTVAFVGAALAVLMCGIGSARGCGMVGEAGAGVITEDPSKFSRIFILQVIPGTQGLYGFVVWFLALNKLGLFSGGLNPSLSLANGAAVFFACLPMAIVGMLSAIAQARVVTAGVSTVSKRPSEMVKVILFAAMVEFYAVLALLASFLMINGAY